MTARKTRSSHTAIKHAVHRVVRPDNIKLKTHHAKPYRKRHYGGLVLFLVLATILFTWLYVYGQQVGDSVNIARDYLSKVFSAQSKTTQIVNSTYGFSLQYDTRKFAASGLDDVTGDVFVGQELNINRAYSTIRLLSGPEGSKNSQRSLTINFYDDKKASSIADAEVGIAENSLSTKGIDTSAVTIAPVDRTTVLFDSKPFNQINWTVSPRTGIFAGKVTSSFRTYSGVIGGRVMVMKVDNGISSETAVSIFDEVLKSLKIGNRIQTSVVVRPQIATKLEQHRSLVDSLLFTAVVSAATPNATAQEQVSSRYSPAVVKIYKAYCMDIDFDGKPYSKDACKAVTGSGFFVSTDGLIATNGHVVTDDPLDVMISDALTYLSLGVPSYFNFLANEAGVKPSDINVKATLNEQLDYVVDKMYSINPSRITVKNNVTNLFVGLNEKKPNVEELLKVTNNRTAYPEQSTILKAEVIRKDYRVIDGISSFKASDVALIKVAGTNYPVVKLGAIESVMQGSELMVIGFPSEASDNEIVDSTASRSTLTSGKVSAIKNVAGGSKKLIETDAMIGHGNSGGPAFTSEGTVVGIATYTVDGSGSGDGTFNYVRDIKDLKELVSAANVMLDINSKTQAEWNRGIDHFYKAHYSAAVKNFAKAKELYPAHPKADELIAVANERIKAGEDVKNYPYLIVGVAIGALIGAVVMVVVILRHRKGHSMYKQIEAESTAEKSEPIFSDFSVTNNDQGHVSTQTHSGSPSMSLEILPEIVRGPHSETHPTVPVKAKDIKD